MDIGTMLGAVIVLAIVGVALYVLFTNVPMNATVKILIQVVVGLFAVLYLLKLVGIVPKFGGL
jgi:predicted membrane channel-forming protein YqfA (hemolysin III family)